MSIIEAFQQHLNEQQEIFTIAWKSLEDVERWLKKNGYVNIGSGKFATAFSKPGNTVVIRISRREDYCWHHFLRWIESQPKNRFLPKIYQTSVYEGEWHGKPQKFSIVATERLKKLTPTAVMLTRDLVGLAELYTTGMFTHDIGRAIEQRFARKNIAKNKIRDWLDDNHHNEFTYTMNILDQLADDTECFFDFHYDNIMYRSSDKSLVLIDPIADMAIENNVTT